MTDPKGQTMTLDSLDRKFYNRSGTLTLYAFACGYIEETDGDLQGVRLWKEGVWHVRRHWNPDGSGQSGYIRQSWWSFDTLTGARAHYRREAKRVLAGDTNIIQQGGGSD